MTMMKRFLAPNPSPMTLTGTNSYLFSDGAVVIVDPGPFILSHLENLLKSAGEKGRLEAILLTHFHPDHAEGAAWLKSQSGAPIAADKNSPMDPDLKLEDNQELRFGNLTFRALFTPGHSRDHICYFHPEGEEILTGDLVLGEGSTTLDPSEGNLLLYMKSLERIAGMRLKTLLPGHGPIARAEERIGEMIRHRKQRHFEILACFNENIRDPLEIVKKVYPGIDPALVPMAIGNVKAHLQLVSQGITNL